MLKPRLCIAYEVTSLYNGETVKRGVGYYDSEDDLMRIMKYDYGYDERSYSIDFEVMY